MVIFQRKFEKNVDVYIKERPFIINDCIENGVFAEDLKLADVSPIFKKEYYYKAKVFERILDKK